MAQSRVSSYALQRLNMAASSWERGIARPQAGVPCSSSASQPPRRHSSYMASTTSPMLRRPSSSPRVRAMRAIWASAAACSASTICSTSRKSAPPSPTLTSSRLARTLRRRSLPEPPSLRPERLVAPLAVSIAPSSTASSRTESRRGVEGPRFTRRLSLVGNANPEAHAIGDASLARQTSRALAVMSCAS